MEEAEALFREAVAGRTATLGANHPDTLASQKRLTNLVEKLIDYSETEWLLRLSLIGMRITVGDGHPMTLVKVQYGVPTLYRSAYQYDA
mgnify:CR=1 FL=1